jgi:hypothetical protein
MTGPQGGGWETKKTSTKNSIRGAKLLQTTKASKQQENEQQRNPLLLNPEDPVSPTAMCVKTTRE